MSSIYAANTWPQDCRPSPRRSASTLRYCTERRRSCGLDPRRVGDRAHRIVCRPGLRARLGARGRSYCVEHYSIAAWLPTWLAILDDVRRS